MKYGRRVRNIAPIVALGLLFSAAGLRAAEPPEGLLKKIAERESQTYQARENYTYRQSVTIEEFDDLGKVTGQYREVRDITYSPNRVRYEQVVEGPKSTLAQIKLTTEDFADLRNVQPFLLTAETLPLYEGKYKGEETIDGQRCFVEYVQPKQILAHQRFFQGTFWVRESDLAVVRTEGQAVPQVETTKEQNLFPHFTTMRRNVDGWWFPVETYGDDTLYFRDWPQRIRVVIRYLNYKRFETQSTITFGSEAPKQ